MGGVGSGDWYRFGKKTTTGECSSVDVHYLHRRDLLKPGRFFSLRWSRAGRETDSIRVMVAGDGRPASARGERVVLIYRHRLPGGEWEDVTEPVPLEWTPCNFGGERPWFLCPRSSAGCGRRVAVLYGPGKYFLCRHCYSLSYGSQRENEVFRALHKAQAVREKLGGSASMLEPFPEKPKGMHWRTYERLREEHDRAEAAQLLGMKEWLDKRERKSR